MPLRERPIVPNFFGRGERQLFGIYHPPETATAPDAGVVLCHPAPQDYSQTYWAFHKLATMLATAGFHVLRFDYSGTGDSAGDSADVTLAEWTRDIATAVEELRDVAGVRRISLVGMRLGAALALTAARDVQVRDLVLWEPVVSGAEYLNSLDAVERRRLSLLSFPEPDDRHPNELMGYAFPQSLRAETGAVDLRLEPIDPDANVLLIAARWTPPFDELERRLARDGIESSSMLVEDPVLYEGGGHPGDVLLAHNIPARITAFLTRRNA